MKYSFIAPVAIAALALSTGVSAQEAGVFDPTTAPVVEPGFMQNWVMVVAAAMIPVLLTVKGVQYVYRMVRGA
ncbi:hypothetical protein ACOTH4_28325 [Achromobacter xylosoxidans]